MNEEIKAFLEELTVLSNKYDIAITGPTYSEIILRNAIDIEGTTDDIFEYAWYNFETDEYEIIDRDKAIQEDQWEIKESLKIELPNDTILIEFINLEIKYFIRNMLKMSNDEGKINEEEAQDLFYQFKDTLLENIDLQNWLIYEPNPLNEPSIRAIDFYQSMYTFINNIEVSSENSNESEDIIYENVLKLFIDTLETQLFNTYPVYVYYPDKLDQENITNNDEE